MRPRTVTGRASASFGAAEIDWLADVLGAVEQRLPLGKLATARPSARVARKVQALKRAAARNAQHRVLRPPSPPPNCKLSDEAVREVRAARAAGQTLAVIARRHGVDASTISKVAKGARYAHVK